MTQNLPPQMQAGASDGPSPLELFYEKNKKWLMGLAILLVVAFVARYASQKFDEAARDKAWSSFTASTGLGADFSTKLDLQPLPPGANEQQQMIQGYLWQHEINKRSLGLIAGLMENVGKVDAAQLQVRLQQAKGTPQEPWLLWVAANRAYALQEWDTAKEHCAALKQGFASHFLCVETPYPPQVRQEKDKGKKKKDEKETDPEEKPELVDPLPGSPVGNLLAAIEKDRAFRAAHTSFFAAPEPETGELAVLKFKDAGEVAIAFYPAAKRHVEEFKKAFAEGSFYKDMRIHKLTLPRKGGDGSGPKALHLGHPGSKDADRTKWRQPVEAKPEEILEFEPTDELSFFPFVVAAEQEKDGKSSARRFFIVTNDAAASYDGEYVILGRVVRGQEKLEEVVAGGMLDETDEAAGEGPPTQALIVEATELRKGDAPK